MAKIIQLPDYLIRQIAAGEVIAEPLSVVKEAIENSIDAGATDIQVSIKNGGMTSISIADNGSGISKEDLEIITTRHSTSKIKTEADLQKVLTLGFRGEFLASLLAAADLTLITKEEHSSQAFKVHFSTGKKPEFEATGRTQGTTLLVNNLFEKIPARRNFLPKPKTSIARIHELVREFSLAYESKRFSLRSDERELFRSQPGSKLNALTMVFGSNTVKNMVPIRGTSENGIWTVEGFISKPVEVRASRTSQYFFVNGRIIENSIIQKALEDGYRNFLAPRKFPIAVLYFTTSADEYDANVHPAKKEIRIRSENIVYQFVSDLVYRTLLHVEGMDYVPAEQSKKVTQQHLSDQFTQNIRKKETQQQPVQQKETSAHTEKQKPLTNKTDQKSTDDFEEEGLSVEEIEQNPLADELAYFYEQRSDRMGNNYFSHVISKKDLEQLEPFLQLDKTFIVATHKEKPQDLYLLDQHAVAERITLEKMVYSRGKIKKQSLLQPIELQVTPDEYTTIQEIYPILKKYGYVFEYQPNLLVKILAIPVYQSKKLTQEQALFNFREILAESLKLQENKAALSGIEDDILKSIACHNSIRAGDNLSITDMKELVKNMQGAKFPYVCCHGRPAIFKVKVEMLHKLFWRS